MTPTSALLGLSSVNAVLDDPHLQSHTLTRSVRGLHVARFSVPGIRCMRCARKITDNLSPIVGETNVRVSVADKEVEVSFQPTLVKLSSIQASMQQAGFAAQLITGRDVKAARSELIRLAVSLALVSNVMLLAVAEYTDVTGSMEDEIRQYFRWLSFAMATIAVTYGAAPFYQNIIHGLKRRRIVIDLPIVLAIIAAYGLSAFSTIIGAGEVYFDSATAIVGLLLTGRYFQAKVMRQAEERIQASLAAVGAYVNVLTEKGGVIKRAAELAPGDRLRLLPGDALMVKARVLEGSSEITYEALTGEPDTLVAHPGSLLKAGAIVQSAALVLEAQESGAESYIARLGEATRRLLSEKGRYVQFADRISTWFLPATLVLTTIIVAFAWQIAPAEAIRRGVAALLVACPCTFGFAAPLAMSVLAARGLRRGIAFRSQTALEDLARVRHVAFDKTGTLTTGATHVEHVNLEQGAIESLGHCRSDVLQLLALLPQFSRHHVPQAVAEWANAQLSQSESTSPAPTPDSIHEELGMGLEWKWQGHHFRLGRPSFCQVQQAAPVVLVANGQLLASFSLSDRPLPEARELMDRLQQRGLQVSLLSGDQDARSQRLATELHIPAAAAVGGLTPTAKALRVAPERDISAMVGNGHNDSLAMAKARLGIAAFGATESCKESSDICLTSPNLLLVDEAFAISQQLNKRIRRCFAFAATYNLIAVGAAGLGWISPVIAAVLMPINSFIVTLLATGGRLRT